MKTYYLIFTLNLSIKGIYGQEKQHLTDSLELQKAKTRVAEISEYYQQEGVEDYTDYVNPAIDTFF